MKKKKLKFYLCLGLCIFAVFVYLWEQVYAKELNYRVSQLNSHLKKVLDENDSLKFNRDSRLSTENMHRISEEKNLKRPVDQSIIRL
jgi:regulator of replication initiation timing